MMSDWKVELVEDNISEFYVDFSGPKDSKYLLTWLTVSPNRLPAGILPTG